MTPPNPLPGPLAEVAERIIGFHENRADPPFLIYQYAPKDEYAVRGELRDLKRWLKVEPRSIECTTISLAEVFWETIANSGYLEPIAEAERAGDYNDAQLSVRQILSNPPTLADRVLDRIAASSGDRSAVFLYRAGALYPYHRTSPLLDELKARVDGPVVMFYPGKLSGDYALSFMSETKRDPNYRTLVIPREGN